MVGRASNNVSLPPKILYFVLVRPFILIDDVACLTSGALGQSQFLTSPVLAKPLEFKNLSLNDETYDLADPPRGNVDSEARLMQMLEAQAAHSVALGFEDDDAVATDLKRSDDEKRDLLQKALNMAASNGDADRVKKILQGKARQFVDIDAPDDDGSPPLIYASCFVSVQSSAPLPKQSVPTNKYQHSYRGTKLSYKASSAQASMSTSKTGINGVRLCGL